MSSDLTIEARTRIRREPQLGFVAAFWWTLGLAVIFAVSWHVSADMTYQRSFDRGLPLGQRASAARFAATLEPWNGRLATRAVLMAKWQQGSELVSQGAYLPATLELADAYKLDVGDSELLALFQKAQQGLSIDSNFKAHIQHGHEGTGGTLRPQDLLP